MSDKATEPSRKGRWSWRKTVAYAFVVVPATLLIAELALRVTGLDARIVAKGVGYQDHDHDAHTATRDPFLHYRLRPSMLRVFGRSPDVPGYRVSIDEHGARGNIHRAEKRRGAYRILAVGGSTTYGYNVDDAHTWPASLEEHLGQRFHEAADPPRPTFAEVWNFGACGYMLSQAAHLGMRQMERLHADLVLVQLHNRGRRPFFRGADPRAAFDTTVFDDETTIFENFAPPTGALRTLHASLMRHSALYRAAAGAWLAHRSPELLEAEANATSFATATALVRRAREVGIDVVFFTLPSDGGRTVPQNVAAELPERNFISLYEPGREPDFYEVHPPPKILAQWARTLGDELVRRGFTKAKPPREE